MEWLELHLDTSPVGIEPMSALLEQQGVEGLIIEDETDFHDFLENNHQYWDYVDEDLMAQKKGKSWASQPMRVNLSSLPQTSVASPSLFHSLMSVMQEMEGMVTVPWSPKIWLPRRD